MYDVRRGTCFRNTRALNRTDDRGPAGTSRWSTAVETDADTRKKYLARNVEVAIVPELSVDGSSNSYI